MPKYDFAIIIPAWNEEEFIESAIAAAQEAMRGTCASGQLIVVDNNSSDRTSAIANALGATVVFEPVNQISRARNAGANAADSRVYLFVDADSTLTSDLLLQVLEMVDRGDIVGGGALVAPDRPVGRSITFMIGLWNMLSRWGGLAAGCFVFSRADAFHAVGGFSHKRYAGEELVFSRALRRRGRSQGLRFRVITDPKIVTSMRKSDWYTGWELWWQFVLVLMPGALNSKRFLRTWYDQSTERRRKQE